MPERKHRKGTLEALLRYRATHDKIGTTPKVIEIIANIMCALLSAKRRNNPRSKYGTQRPIRTPRARKHPPNNKLINTFVFM